MTKARVLGIEDHDEMIEFIRLLLEGHEFEFEGAIAERVAMNDFIANPFGARELFAGIERVLNLDGL